MPFQPKEIHSRLLYPFYFKEKSLIEATDKLSALIAPTRREEKAVWENVGKPTHYYLQESLSVVRRFLFPAEEDSGGCHYMKVQNDQLNSWFSKKIRIEAKKGQEIYVCQLVAKLGIELFLSPFGVGVMSISLAGKNDDNQKFNLDTVKQLNYRLSQFSRKDTVADFVLPHNEKAPPPPAPDSPLLERLGKAGSSFQLIELVKYLLEPLNDLELNPAQEQFSVYTVVRFDKNVDFSQSKIKEELGVVLAGLAQVEEIEHVGAVKSEKLNIANQILNSRHWAGVGFLGCSHLVADQEPSHPFDEQRVPTVRDKYFIPYLTALFQRHILHRFIDEAARLVRMEEKSGYKDSFRSLHTKLLDFTVTGHFTEVSNREVINSFYKLSQKGLGVEKALDVVSRAIHSHNVDDISKELATNVSTVSHVQNKIEWLEVFFVSFYATELSHIISENFFSHVYTSFSVLVWPVLAGAIAFWGLKPWRNTPEPSNSNWRHILVLVLLTIGLWFAVGFNFFAKEIDAHKQTTEAQVSPH